MDTHYGRKEDLMKNKRRKTYCILTSIFFFIGIFFFGMINVIFYNDLNIQMNRMISFVIYGLSGGVMLAGILSGWLLFSNYISTKGLACKVLCCVFFPIVFWGVTFMGIVSFVPYSICNLVEIKKYEIDSDGKIISEED